MTRCPALLVALLITLSISQATSTCADSDELPSFGEVQRIVELSFHSAGQRPDDIISKSQVQQLLATLKQKGWDVDDKQEILDATLEDQHVLVSSLRTPAGKRFMGKISSRDLMYDRLDRISQVSGGPQLIRDLVKLPDGEKYAKPRSGGGVPDLLDLLPKNASGKTRRIADYHKPTGNIYTPAALLDRLAKSYEKAAEGKALDRQEKVDH